MQIHHEEISDVSRYIANHRHIGLEDKEIAYQNYLRQARQFHAVDESTVMLEIGTGTGWFPLLCKARGLNCKGLEISPQLIDYAKEFGARYGVDPDIELGNIEDSDIGEDRYDVIFLISVFEHVEHWELGLRKVYRALKPGGIVVFESTNKFSPTSGEYSFPLYGWLPDRLRYRLRMARQGADIMHLGIDFNQFRYPMLR
ncbi:MAG: class I SAM-dependent methyltransferase, partial [Nitrospirota bacterium]